MRFRAASLTLAILFQAGSSLAQIDIEAGRQHWAYQPLQNAAAPAVIDHRWARGEIDRLLLAKIEAAGMRPVGDASPATLIRRATYDLTGLPPSPEEVGAFLAATDSSGIEAAFRALVERLLASPAYGERWGRHWLDVVRYADTSGSSSDHPVPEAQLYRDYVIAAFNKDKPFDRFVREQIAGDLLEHADDNERRECIIATGYLAGARRFGVSGKEAHLTIEDTITNLGEAFLATSVQCARCHDHTHDAIPSTDYYALYGIFQSTRYPFPGAENQKTPTGFVSLSPEAAAERAKLDAEMEEVNDQLRRLNRSARGRKLGAEESAQKSELTRRSKELRKRLAEQTDLAYAVTDANKIGDAYVHLIGDPGDRGDEVRRGFLQVLGAQTLPDGHQGSGRLQLANWITGEDNPLFARVIVNRVWAWHFGRGIVASANDFGTYGETPSHPGLLDRLARDFIDSGYSIKDLHRRIMASRAYGLSSEMLEANGDTDPEAKLRWRFDRRLLTAEEVRDSMLAAGGRLKPGPAPPHPFPKKTGWGFTQHNPFYASYEHDHRSVYLMQQRIRRQPLLAVFDAADPNASTPQREQNAGPVQSLFLMNDPFAHDAADALALRMVIAHADTASQIDLAHRLLFGRAADEGEITIGKAYLTECRAALGENGSDDLENEASALASYARVLFCSNEFVYID